LQLWGKDGKIFPVQRNLCKLDWLIYNGGLGITMKEDKHLIKLQKQLEMAMLKYARAQNNIRKAQLQREKARRKMRDLHAAIHLRGIKHGQCCTCKL